MKLGNIFKKFKGIDAAILLVSLSIIIVMIVLFVKKSSKEAFQVSTLAENWWSIKGLDGSPGEDGNDFNLENVKTNTETKVINDMIAKELIVNDGTEAEPNYFPVGIINMKTVIDSTKKNISYSSIDNNEKFFSVNYEKKANKSFVKISYTITLTGNNYKGNQFTIFKGDKQISVKTAMAGLWHGGWVKKIPKSITITGIDTDNTKGTQTYFVKIEKYSGGNGNGQSDIYINGQLETAGKYNNDGYLSSSCTIEEIMVPNKEDIATSFDFVNN